MKKVDLDLVLRYVENELTTAGKEEFEAKMGSDPGLKELVERVRSIQEDLRDTESLRLRMKLDKIMKSNPKLKKGRLKPSRGLQHFLMAAILVALVGFSALIYMSISAYFRMDDVDRGPGRFNIFRQDVNYITPVYREMLRYETRSDQFRLTEPVDSAIFTVKSDIIFRWETEIPDPMYLEVMNRHGKIVYAPRDPVTSPCLMLQRQSRGAYIYRFRTDSIAVHYGVMFIE